MTYQTIVYERAEERIARLTLNRPEKLNAMSPALLGEFDEALAEFERDSDASVLVIRGAGRSFCAGYDLTAGGEGGRYTITEDRWAMRRLVERWQRLWSLPKPTIAQVHGHCLAGGMTLCANCKRGIIARPARRSSQAFATSFSRPRTRSSGIPPGEPSASSRRSRCGRT